MFIHVKRRVTEFRYIKQYGEVVFADLNPKEDMASEESKKGKSFEDLSNRFCLLTSSYKFIKKKYKNNNTLHTPYILLQ